MEEMLESLVWKTVDKSQVDSHLHPGVIQGGGVGTWGHISRGASPTCRCHPHPYLVQFCAAIKYHPPLGGGGEWDMTAW